MENATEQDTERQLECGRDRDGGRESFNNLQSLHCINDHQND